jgi:hypothetical protein
LDTNIALGQNFNNYEMVFMESDVPFKAILLHHMWWVSSVSAHGITMQYPIPTKRNLDICIESKKQNIFKGMATYIGFRG